MPSTFDFLARRPAGVRRLRRVLRPWLASALAVAAAAALAEGSAVPGIFKGADLALGETLLRQHRCNECHARRVGGDGSLMYRPWERLHEAGALRGMVEACNTELSLQMFPDEVTAVAAVLNRDHYRFER